MRTRAQPQSQTQVTPQASLKTRPRRHNANWTINENLRLEREYELLKLNTHEIALLHERTEASIINRLVLENLIEHRTDARRQ
jgi:hypothetical protein